MLSTNSWDIFFSYGLNPLNMEIESDLIQLIEQPQNSLYYFRSYGGALTTKLNRPNSVALQISTQYDIANAVANQNILVSSSNPDRRVAVSQNMISITQNGNQMDVSIFAIPYYDYTQGSTITLPLYTSI